MFTVIAAVLAGGAVAVYVSARTHTLPGQAPKAGNSVAAVPGTSSTPDLAARLDPQMGPALDAAQDALLRGDRAGFLALAAPRSQAATILSRLYANLRAMHVATASAGFLAYPTVSTSNPTQLQTTVRFGYCFGAAGCIGDAATDLTTWMQGPHGPLLTELQPDTSHDYSEPRPWEVSDLKAIAGKRTVVATTAAYASRLSALSLAAERAAAVADHLAKWGRPSRYVVYFAGKSEWGKWFGGGQPRWAAGYQFDGTHEVVLDGPVWTSNDELVFGLRHELTHTATLYGSKSNPEEKAWFLTEGIAEYALMTGYSTSQYGGLSALHRWLRTARWNGQVAIPMPADNASAATVTAGYAIGFLTVRRLAQRFGEAKMLAFFAAVVRDGESLATAALQVLGVSWANVNADCARYVRANA